VEKCPKFIPKAPGKPLTVAGTLTLLIFVSALCAMMLALFWFLPTALFVYLFRTIF
jgi:hypothetical protein